MVYMCTMNSMVYIIILDRHVCALHDTGRKIIKRAEIPKKPIGENYFNVFSSLSYGLQESKRDIRTFAYNVLSDQPMQPT